MSDADVPGLFFLDTNILAYSFDLVAPQKQKIADQLLTDALETQRGIISTQIVQEFINLALRKFARPMNVPECREYLQKVLLPLCRYYPSLSSYDRALLIVCLLYTSDAADERSSVDLGGRRIIQKKKHKQYQSPIIHQNTT